MDVPSPTAPALPVCVDECVDNFWEKLATWAILIIVKGERTRQRLACLCNKQTPRLPIKFPKGGLSHVYEWSCWVSRHSYRYLVCVVLVTYPSGARCRRRQRLALWYRSIIRRGSKSGAGVLDNCHLEQTAKLLCAQDTTLSRKCILLVSARPRRQMTAGTVMSSNHQVRLKATCRNPLKPSFWAVCRIVLHTGHHIHRAHASWRRVYCVTRQVMYACMWPRWTYCGKEWIIKRHTLVM